MTVKALEICDDCGNTIKEKNIPEGDYVVCLNKLSFCEICRKNREDAARKMPIQTKDGAGGDLRVPENQSDAMVFNSTNKPAA